MSQLFNVNVSKAVNGGYIIASYGPHPDGGENRIASYEYQLGEQLQEIINQQLAPHGLSVSVYVTKVEPPTVEEAPVDSDVGSIGAAAIHVDDAYLDAATE